MGKKKLQRFADIETFPNVFHLVQSSAEIPFFNLKGKWHEKVFKNLNPIILELGCGKGEYTCDMAENMKDKNFIGADLKGNRIWKGAKYCLDYQLNNAAFLRTRIENIHLAFEKDEVSEIWITFPDPQPQKTRERKRLTSTDFLNKYKLFLKKDGLIHLKTDSDSLYQYSVELVEKENHLLVKSDDIYNDFGKPEFKNLPKFITSIQTHYEKLFTAKGFTIKYLQFKLHL